MKALSIKYKASLVILVMVIATFGFPITSTSAAATIITFEQFDIGTQLSDQLQSEGVLFEAVLYDPAESGSFSRQFPYVEVVGDFVPLGQRAILSPPRSVQNDVLITFVVPGSDAPAVTGRVSVSLDSATPFDFGDDLVHLRAFDTLGNELAVDTLPDNAPGPLEVSASGIHYVIIDYERLSPDAGEHYDNVSFDSLTPVTMEVDIDIKPGSYPNSINPRSKGVIPVAILTTVPFDATTVDPLSVQFGPSGATEAHNRSHIEDVDGDGDQDLVLHFKTQDAGIQCGDTLASLSGETFDGQLIVGSDSINTVGCK